MLAKKKSEISEESIEILVYRFYDKIRIHQALGPVFNQAIQDHQWPEHLKTMCQFWSSLMLKSGKYGGNPLQKHLALPKFDASLFDEWLKLFAETTQEIFDDPTAKLFQSASQNIARSFKYMMYDYPTSKQSSAL